MQQDGTTTRKWDAFGAALFGRWYLNKKGLKSCDKKSDHSMMSTEMYQTFQQNIVSNRNAFFQTVNYYMNKSGNYPTH